MSVTSKLRQIAKRDDSIGALTRLCYTLLGSPLTQAVINGAVLPTLVAVAVNLFTADKPPPNVRAFLVSAVLFQIIFTLTFFVINNHKQRKIKDILWFQHTLSSHAGLNAHMGNYTFTINKRIIQSDKRNAPLDLAVVKDIAGFQRIGFRVCEDIYDIVKNHFSCPNCLVTIFQPFKENDYSYTKMTAYHAFGAHIPETFPRKYKLESIEHDADPFHLKIFKSRNPEIRVLSCSDDVNRVFRQHSSPKSRERSICQYIGIPIQDSQGDIVFLLQIDVGEAGILGQNDDELFELARNVLMPYVQFLYLSYEQERLLETLYQRQHIVIKNVHKEIE